MTDPGFPTPEQAALASLETDHGIDILAVGIGEDLAGVLVTAPTWPSPELIKTVRSQAGWEECGSGSGRQHWTAFGDSDLGTLIWWSEAPEGSRRVLVTFRERTYDLKATKGYFVLVVDDVDEGALDDAADVEVAEDNG